MKKILILSAVLLVALSAGCDGCRGKDGQPTAREETAKPVTGLRVSVQNAEGKPVLSRVAVTRAGQTGYGARVTETWVQPATSGTVISVPEGKYVITAQGTGDSFMRTEAEVKPGKLSEVSLGFATLVLAGDNVKEQGRVRVWQQLGEGKQQIVVTRLVRPGEKAPLALASGKYKVGFLPQGLTDEDENFTPFGGILDLEPGSSITLPVAAP